MYLGVNLKWQKLYYMFNEFKKLMLYKRFKLFLKFFILLELIKSGGKNYTYKIYPEKIINLLLIKLLLLK